MTAIAAVVLGTDIDPTTFGNPVVEALNKLGKGCSLIRTTAQSIPNNAPTVVTFDSEEWDDDGFHSTVTNTGRITIPSGWAGRFLVTTNLPWAGGGNQALTWLHKNGSGAIRWATAGGLNNATYALNTPASVVMDLAVGDYLELIAFQNSGGAQNIGSSTGRAFQIAMIGPA